MSEINNGGPAFPVWELNGSGNPEMTCFGMTLRDYFAAKAMQADLTAGGIEGCDVEAAAAMAYEMADAMIKARGER